MPDHVLRIFCEDRPIGALLAHSDGSVDFVYDQGVGERDTVSLAMLPTANPDEYLGFNGLPLPFEVSLPEGWLWQRLNSRYGKLVDLSDDIALLKLVGTGLIGRITVGGPRQNIPLNDRWIQAARSGHAAESLSHVLHEIPPEYMGLSGVMPKISLRGGTDHAHGTVIADEAIVKFETPEYPAICLAEDFALRAARDWGLTAAECTLSDAGDALFIQRFDIYQNGSRLGFEDACCLSGLRRNGKYRGSIQGLFEMVESYVSEEFIPADRLQLTKMVILNDILRNGDAHLKNFGLLYSDPEHVRLAPAYDVLDTTLYIPSDVPALALRNGSDVKRWMTAEDLDALQDLSGLDEDVRDLYRDGVDRARDMASRYADILSHEKSLPRERQALARKMGKTIRTRLSSSGANVWSAPTGTTVPA
ncbi:MAG: type II toxin-antitoxin system HipA family toxin [Acidiferrobacter sp.]